ncbi:perosamine synthetase [Stackebrandtia endophytica]|uniref:Perosamine synthetase n=1 Tax=Stackebrandtia endophytica TaxID=1496996 RepID=A0A543AZ94_9ACTN|nr:DegT/DnrJ/EryC1/StrS family aminotransferase [Stackebrandtia endophytica]TQL77894.1 perosamine synthetase [Stackebrandtia endophytica]
MGSAGIPSFIVDQSAGATVTDTKTSIELAVNGGEPIRPRPISVNARIGADTRQALLDLLDGDHPTSLYYGGDRARELEAAFARYHSPTAHAVAVNSGTSALHLALAAAGIGRGDEVIIPALCFVAAASAVVQQGAIPVICDAEPDGLTMDVAMAESLITARTKAIMPVHFWGYPSDVPALRRLCDRHGLTLIEDACQAPGAPVGDTRTGILADYAAYSFSNRKFIHSGDGGMVLCHDAETAERLRSISNYGKGPGWDDYHQLGYSYRMTELCALLALDGLAHLDEEIAGRRYAADLYRKALDGTPLEPVAERPWGRGVYFKLPILVPRDRIPDRKFIVDALVAENVSSRIPHRPVYEIPWLADYLREHDRYRGAEQCPVSADAHPRLFEVETGPNLPADEAALSVRAVQKVWAAVTGEVTS